MRQIQEAARILAILGRRKGVSNDLPPIPVRAGGMVALAGLFPPRPDRRRVPLPEVHRQVVDWLRWEARREFEARSPIAQFRPMLK